MREGNVFDLFVRQGWKRKRYPVRPAVKGGQGVEGVAQSGL